MMDIKVKKKPVTEVEVKIQTKPEPIQMTPSKVIPKQVIEEVEETAFEPVVHIAPTKRHYSIMSSILFMFMSLSVICYVFMISSSVFYAVKMSQFTFKADNLSISTQDSNVADNFHLKPNSDRISYINKDSDTSISLK